MTKFVALLLIDLRLIFRSKLAVFWSFGFPLLLLYAQTQLGNKAGKVSAEELTAICAGLIAIVVASSALLGFAGPLVQAREMGILRSCKMWPLHPLGILGAMACARLVLMSLAALPILLAAHWGMGLRWHANPWPQGVVLASVLLLGGAACLAVALAIAARSSNTQTALAICNIVYFAAIFLGEVFFDARQLPLPAAQLLALLPINALVHAIDAVLIQEWRSLPTSICVLTLWLVGASSIALKRFRWDAPRSLVVPTPCKPTA